METSYLKTLELDKIIARAAEGCVCKEARAMLLAIEPQCDPDEVRYALEQTDAINTLLIKNGSPRFGGVEGVSQLAARAVKGGVLSMGELLMVAGALRNFQHLTSWYGSSEHDALPTDDLFYALAPEPGLEQQISSSILAPDSMADTASRTLAELRKKIRATENSIRDRLESMVRNMDTSKYLQESVVSMRNGRYVVPVKSEYRGEVSGIIHDVSSTGATVFVEPQAVVEANARILQYRAQEAQEIERILVAFTAQVAAIEPQFQYSYKAMLEIDILLAKARLALELKAFKPAVRTDSSFNLIRARHPLIDPQKCVPVDIALGGEYDSLIITGPNTGGKTVTLKTAGLLCAMAQCGFLIPADERSEVCVFDEFLVDIGDEQSIEQSLSTFSGHMKKITGILELAMPHTLVLLDELGAGTDPAEGAALAVAIIEELRRRGVLLMATTHYAELKVFALETKGVVNASCEFDLETLRPTYKLSVGVPGKSNAFLISEKLGIPSRVIEAAQQHLSAEDKRLDAVLGQLDDLKLQLKESQNEVEQLRNEASHQLEAARKKRLHRKIFLSISIPLAVLIAAFVVVLIVYIIPQNHYNDAAVLLEAGKYDEAITAFTALDGYSDSAARITEAEYKKACDLLENEKFAEAIEAFTALGDYEDSKDRITEAEYRRAVKTFESGAYEDALNLLEPLKDYKDAAEKIETCHYELGMKALEADNLKSAAAHFKEVNAEQNKKMQAAFCDKGIAFYEKGDEEKALTYFEYVTDKDLLPKIDAAYYAQALKLVEDGEYDKATEIFAKLGEYEDCPTQLLRIHALKAEQYYNNADYENAIAEFKAAGDYGDAASRVTEATYRLGAQQLANGEVRKAYDTLYPIRSYAPAYMLLVSNSQFYIQIYDVGAGPNPLNEN